MLSYVHSPYHHYSHRPLWVALLLSTPRPPPRPCTHPPDRVPTCRSAQSAPHTVRRKRPTAHSPQRPIAPLRCVGRACVRARATNCPAVSPYTPTRANVCAHRHCSPPKPKQKRPNMFAFARTRNSTACSTAFRLVDPPLSLALSPAAPLRRRCRHRPPSIRTECRAVLQASACVCVRSRRYGVCVCRAIVSGAPGCSTASVAVRRTAPLPSVCCA